MSKKPSELRVSDLDREFREVRTKADLAKFRKKITGIRKELDGDKDNLRKLFYFMRKRKMLSVEDTYKLNALEIKDCTEKATYVNKFFSPAQKCHIGEDYDFKCEYNEEKGTDIYTYYVKRTVPGESQIGKALEQKIARGFMPEQSDYPEDKVLIDRHQLVEGEFLKYFEVIE
jgi:hypothetical protein